MNPEILKLVSIATAPSRIIIGLMSGTSLDGLDIALCRFTGAGFDTQVKVLHFTTIPYPEDFKQQLKGIAFKKLVDLQQLTLLNAVAGTYSAELILQVLKEWNFPAESVDLIASHGQTVFHAPFSHHQLAGWPNATLQIGDGDHIAVKTGIITLSDFRQKHVAAGAEGAPLALYGDILLFSDERENRILLNIGGISNFTFLPAGKNIERVFSTDVGPGNTLMDQFVQLHYPGKQYDAEAEIALSGMINEDLVAVLKDHPFFKGSFPKTTGPELFNLDYLQSALKRTGQQSLKREDILASLCAFTAESIVEAVLETGGGQPLEVYLSGGGMHNPLLVKKIAEGLGQELKTTAMLGINPDAKEAVLFALLANECLAEADPGSGHHPRLRMGKISLPK